MSARAVGLATLSERAAGLATLSEQDWRELLKRLAEPFPEEVIYWRAGGVSRDRKRAQALPYADARVYEDRLNELLPGEWSVSFRAWGEGRIICDLTLHGVTRSSTGEASDGFAPGTAAEAQAFKRACSKFRLGRYLYEVEAPWVAYDDERKELLEAPRLPARFLPDPGLKTEARDLEPRQEPASPPLSLERAEAMHRELARLGLKRGEHYSFAAKVLDMAVETFTALTEDQALQVWNEAKRRLSVASKPRRDRAVAARP
jgi:hypothetical protein